MNKTAIVVGVVAGATITITNVMILSKMYNVEADVAHLKQEIKEVKKEVALVKTSNVLHLTSAEQDCLAKNIFHEAGVEPKAGKIAVAQVTLNRLQSGKWGKDLCKVVYAKAQFSWTLQKKKRHAQPKGDLWRASVQAAHDFQKGVRVTLVDNSQFYHTDYIQTPKWVDPSKETAKVGKHIFYATAKRA